MLCTDGKSHIPYFIWYHNQYLQVHQGSIFHISEPIYYEILEETRVLMKQAVFSTSHVNTSWDKRKNLAFIVIQNDE